MKKNEIVVGQRYAHSRFNGYRPNGRHMSFSAQGVEVLSEPETRKSATYPYAKRSVVRVRSITTGAEYDVPTREIREPWEPYLKDAAEWAQARREGADRVAAARRERAKRVPVIVEALRKAGVEDERGYVGDNIIRTLLSQAIPDAFDFEANGEPSNTFEAPLGRSLEAYVKDGSPLKISAEVLMAVLR